MEQQNNGGVVPKPEHPDYVRIRELLNKLRLRKLKGACARQCDDHPLSVEVDEAQLHLGHSLLWNVLDLRREVGELAAAVRQMNDRRRTWFEWSKVLLGSGVVAALVTVSVGAASDRRVV